MSEGLEAVATEIVTDTPAQETPASEESGLWSEDSTESEEPESSPEAVETPEWFMKDKYKTVEDQAKAGYELQKKMGKFWGPPQGEYELGEDSGMSNDDPLLKHLTPVLKEMGLSNEAFNGLAKGYQEANMKLVEDMTRAVEKDLKLNNALEIQAVDKWLMDSFDKTERERIRNWVVSVEDFQTLNTLRAMLPAKSTVASSQSSMSTFESSDDVTSAKVEYKQAVAKGERKRDKNFEDKLFTRFNDAARREQRNR